MVKKSNKIEGEIKIKKWGKVGKLSAKIQKMEGGN